MSIADDYNFYPNTELPKAAFEKAFIAHISEHGNTNEVVLRYGDKNKKPSKSKKDTSNGAVEAKPIQLYPFQIKHKKKIIEGLDRYTTFGLFSETGTGKSYLALSVSTTERRPLIICCPKAMVLDWYILSLQHPIEILCICNYETLIKGKMYAFGANVNLDKLVRVDCPYVKKVEGMKGRKKHISFEWTNLPERSLIVFDEAHYCKNPTTQRSKLMTSAYEYANHPQNRIRKIGLLLLSATIIEKKANLRPFMYVLGYANSPSGKSVVDDIEFKVRDFGMKLISERRMTRATMAEARKALGDSHTSDVKTKMFSLDDEDRVKIEALCTEIREILLATSGDKPKNHLAIRMQKRQEIEALKVGILFKECVIQREAGYAVVIFVNFKGTLEALISMVKQTWPKDQAGNEQYSLIVGGQEAQARLKQVQMFQSGATDIMLAMITAGGIGIGLHDLQGGRPRYGLMSPPESATVTVQALGRIDRIGAKTDSIQRIIFIKDTIEEKIAENLNQKIQTIGDLNGDEDADNLFLFEVCHKYKDDEDDEKVESNFEPATISVAIDKQNNRMIITVPDYMVDSFESGIPKQCLPGMQYEDDKYFFALDHLTDMHEFLNRLNE
ncbi:MAG: helicase-related protein [Candidatus Roizmanbacteria bacterium]